MLYEGFVPQFWFISDTLSFFTHNLKDMALSKYIINYVEPLWVY